MQRNLGVRDQLRNLKNREQDGKFSPQQNLIKKKRPTSGPDPAAIQKYLANKQGKNLSNREASLNYHSSIKKKLSGPDPEAIKRYLDRKNQEEKLKEQEYLKRISLNQNCKKRKQSSRHDAEAIKLFLSKKEQEKISKSKNQNEKHQTEQVKKLSVAQDSKKKPTKLNPALQRYLERNKQERNPKEEVKTIPTQQENIGSNFLLLQRIPKKNSSGSSSKTSYSVKESLEKNYKDDMHSKTSNQQKCLLDKRSTSESDAFNLQKSLANKNQVRNSDNKGTKKASLNSHQNLTRTSMSKIDPSNVQSSIKKKETDQIFNSKLQVKNSSNHLNLNIKKKPKPGPDLATIQRFLARRELEKNSKTREIIKKPQLKESAINKKQPSNPNSVPLEKLVTKRTNEEDFRGREKQPIKKFAPIGYSYKRSVDYDDESEIDDEMRDFIDDGDDFESQKEDVSRYIKEIFGYDKNKYLYDDDDDIEEASFAQQMKEEMRSTKIGILEDLEDMRKEEEERKAKKRKKRVIDDDY